MPTFSIIMATHSRPGMLREAIDSVLNQTFPDWELVVIDDCGEVPAEVPDDPRIRLIRNPTTLGPAATRNLGIRVATGDYIAILDDDDLYRRDRLQNALKAHEVAPDMALCGESILGETPPRGSTSVSLRASPRSWILNGTAPSMSRLTVRRSICPEFDESYPASADLDWWLRATDGVPEIGWFTSPDWIWRRHDGPRGIIGPSRRLEASRRLLREHREFFRRNATARAFRLRRIGAMSLQLGQRPQALLAICRSMLAKPSLGAMKLLALTLGRMHKQTPEENDPSRVSMRDLRGARDNGKSVLRGTIYSDQLGQAYVRTMAGIITKDSPLVQFAPWAGLGVKVLASRRPAAVQIQWFDVLLRRRRPSKALLGVLRMVSFLAVLRLGGVPSLVIFHNPVGKGHSRILLDRILRTALVLIGSSFVVLNEGADEIVQREIFGVARKRFTERVSVVPHPNRIVDHGTRMPTGDARRRLGISSCLPVVVYFPGAHQQLASGLNLVDPQKRYTLLQLERGRGPLEFEEAPGTIAARGTPSDEEFGLLISAADAVLLTDQRAFGSATLHAAVGLGRPVIGPDCPATRELFGYGGGHGTVGVPTPDEIAEGLEKLAGAPLFPSFDLFEARHRDAVVAEAAGLAFLRTGMLQQCNRVGRFLSLWAFRA